MTGGVREDGVERGYCAEEGEECSKRPVDRLEVRFATKAEVRRRQRGAEERCNDREVIGLTSNAAHGFAVIEGDVVAAVVSLQPFSKVATATAAAAYLPRRKKDLHAAHGKAHHAACEVHQHGPHNTRIHLLPSTIPPLDDRSRKTKNQRPKNMGPNIHRLIMNSEDGAKRCNVRGTSSSMPGKNIDVVALPWR